MVELGDFGKELLRNALSEVEKVNHPAHYGGDTIYEAIKVINAWSLNFNLGNTVKYICRAGKKDHSDEIEDLEKALFYLKYEIEIRKVKKEGK